MSGIRHMRSSQPACRPTTQSRGTFPFRVRSVRRKCSETERHRGGSGARTGRCDVAPGNPWARRRQWGGALEAGGGREGGRGEIGERGGHTARATRRAARRCAGEERTLARRGRRTRVEGAQARGHAEGDAATPPTGAMAMATPNAAVEAIQGVPSPHLLDIGERIELPTLSSMAPVMPPRRLSVGTRWRKAAAGSAKPSIASLLPAAVLKHRKRRSREPSKSALSTERSGTTGAMDAVGPLESIMRAERAKDIESTRKQLAAAHVSGRSAEEVAAEVDALPSSQRQVVLATMLHNERALRGIANACTLMSSSHGMTETLTNVARATHELLKPAEGVTVHVEVPRGSATAGGAAGADMEHDRTLSAKLIEHALPAERAGVHALHPLQQLIANAFNGEVKVSHKKRMGESSLATRTCAYVCVPCASPADTVAQGHSPVIAVILLNFGEGTAGKQATEQLDHQILLSLGRHAGTCVANALAKQTQEELARTTATLLSLTRSDARSVCT